VVEVVPAGLAAVELAQFRPVVQVPLVYHAVAVAVARAADAVVVQVVAGHDVVLVHFVAELFVGQPLHVGERRGVERRRAQHQRAAVPVQQGIGRGGIDPVELVADVVVGGAVLIVHGIAGIADGLALVAGRTHQFVGAVGDRLGGDGQEGGCFAAVLLAVGLGLAAVVKTFRGNAGGIVGEVIAIPD